MKQQFSRQVESSILRLLIDMTDGSQMFSARSLDLSKELEAMKMIMSLKSPEEPRGSEEVVSFSSRFVWLQLFLPDSRVRISFLICVWTSNSQYVNLQRK